MLSVDTDDRFLFTAPFFLKIPPTIFITFLVNIFFNLL